MFLLLLFFFYPLLIKIKHFIYSYLDISVFLHMAWKGSNLHKLNIFFSIFIFIRPTDPNYFEENPRPNKSIGLALRNESRLSDFKTRKNKKIFD